MGSEMCIRDSPLVRADIPADYVTYLKPFILARIDLLDAELSKRSFIVPDILTVADTYMAWFIRFLTKLMPEVVAGRDSLKTYERQIKSFCDNPPSFTA